MSRERLGRPGRLRACGSRLASAWALAVVASCGLPTVAPGAQLHVEGGVLIYVAAPYEESELSAYADGVTGDSVVVRDSAQVTAGSGCIPWHLGPEGPSLAASYECFGVRNGVGARLEDGDDTAEISPPSGVPVYAFAGEGNDFISVGSGAGRGSIEGGAGDDRLSGAEADDTIMGGDGDDTIYGAPGDDVVEGGSGNDILAGDFSSSQESGPKEDLVSAGDDRIDGGAGNDELVGGAGNDLFIGGSGKDTVDFSGRSETVTVRIDALPGSGQGAERDIVGFDIEVVRTGRGSDRVWAGLNPATVATGVGDDTVRGGPRRDVVDTGPGRDVVEARDGRRDRVTCGEGADLVRADAKDWIAADCETVRRASPSRRVGSRARRPSAARRARRGEDTATRHGSPKRISGLL
jgi:hypothetical protein